MLRPQFPHFPRKFSARLVPLFGSTSLWAAATAFLIFNVYTRVTLSPPYWNTITAVLERPSLQAPHLALARNYWSLGYQARARQELLFAQTLPSPRETGTSSLILGATTSPSNLLQELEGKWGHLEREYRFWQSVVKDKPDYRDAYLALSALAYQLSRRQEARAYLTHVLSIDPNDHRAQQLLGVLSKEDR